MPAVSPSRSRPPLRRADAPSVSPDASVPRWLVEVLDAESFTAAAQQFADQLPSFLRECQLAVGWSGREPTCRVAAVSHRSRLDRTSELVGAIEAALDETLARGASLAAPPSEAQIPARTHERLLQLTGSRWVVSHQLIDRQGNALGSILLWGEQPEQQALAVDWLQRTTPIAATTLRRCQQAHQSAVSRVLQAVRIAAGKHRRRIWLIGLAAALTLLALPWPHRIRCDCTVEPTVRRFVAAPFDATLQATLVKPGDIVSAGQPVVQLEGREIKWELASLIAEYERAVKTRDRALAERETSAAQLAELEIEQLEHQIALLEDREKHLTVASPIEGVVLSGDLSRDVGAPVATGQTLLEIAPLAQVVIEAAIAEDKIAHVPEQAVATVRIEAFPGRPLRGELTTIYPQAELRDNQQVFIAELPLENVDRALRPGMQGVAKIQAGWTTLGWKLFHRPYYAFTGWLGW